MILLMMIILNKCWIVLKNIEYLFIYLFIEKLNWATSGGEGVGVKFRKI